MTDFIYAPYVLKMAATKRSALKGKAQRKLDGMIAAARAADDATMSMYADLDNPAWVAASDAAQKVLAELLAFADPIVPHPDDER